MRRGPEGKRKTGRTAQEQIEAGKGAGAARAENRAAPAERGGRWGEANKHTERHPLPLPAVTAARSPGTESRPLPPAPRGHPPQPFLAGAGPGRQLRQPHAWREREQRGAR